MAGVFGITGSEGAQQSEAGSVSGEFREALAFADTLRGLDPLGRTAIRRTWERAVEYLEIYEPDFLTRIPPLAEGFDIEEASRQEIGGHSHDLEDWLPEHEEDVMPPYEFRGVPDA